jgi:endonuclease III
MSKTVATSILTPTASAPKKVAALAMLAELRKLHPTAHCELHHQSPFELLCATVMSAQTTDVAVNKVTPALFAAFPNASAMAKAMPTDVEALINTLGMYRQKSKNLIALAQLLVAHHGGQVPKTLAELVALPGVGRKTANVVLGVAFGTPEGVVVDTHVQRLSQRLGWTRQAEPPAIEQELMQLIPKKDWDIVSHTLIFHGRRVCFARKPGCDDCGVANLCPSRGNAEHVGRKPSVKRPAQDVREKQPEKVAGAAAARVAKAATRKPSRPAGTLAAKTAAKTVKRPATKKPS